MQLVLGYWALDGSFNLVMLFWDIALGFTIHLHSCGLDIKVRVHSWHSWGFGRAFNNRFHIFIPQQNSFLWVIVNILAMPVGESQNGRSTLAKKIDTFNDQ